MGRLFVVGWDYGTYGTHGTYDYGTMEQWDYFVEDYGTMGQYPLSCGATTHHALRTTHHALRTTRPALLTHYLNL